MREPECRVCGGRRLRPFLEIDGLSYHRCGRCEATLLSARQLPGPAAERRHYAHHENDVDDPNYRRFLTKLVHPLAERLQARSTGLDYGCGPGPAAAAMLREMGHEVVEYDPFFRPDGDALERTYDFILCSEVVEHFHSPADEFRRLDRLLAPGGWLGIMTCFQTDDEAFAKWHYRRDPTHVAFYRESTLRLVAARYGWSCVIPVKDVALMRKSRRSSASRLSEEAMAPGTALRSDQGSAPDLRRLRSIHRFGRFQPSRLGRL
jgi:SAM-dependent methyltransferase